jgi:hypothetical protein
LSPEIVVCCQVENSASDDHSSRGVLPRVACITECDHETSIMRKPWPATGCCKKDEEREVFSLILVRVSLTSLLIIESLIISKELNTVNLTKQ